MRANSCQYLHSHAHNFTETTNYAQAEKYSWIQSTKPEAKAGNICWEVIIIIGGEPLTGV